MKRNNKGFTLIELIIAVAISVIVLGAASMMLGSAQKSYRIAEETINLQKESQILMERLAGFIMESNYVELKGANVLILKTVPRNNDKEASDLPVGYVVPKTKTVVIWQKGNKLYYKEDNTEDKDHEFVVNTSFLDSWAIEDNCISEYIETFTPVYNTSKKQQVKISLLMKSGSQSYALTDDIKIRNEII